MEGGGGGRKKERGAVVMVVYCMKIREGGRESDLLPPFKIPYSEGPRIEKSVKKPAPQW